MASKMIMEPRVVSTLRGFRTMRIMPVINPVVSWYVRMTNLSVTHPKSMYQRDGRYATK